jgi:hypothetical protein
VAEPARRLWTLDEFLAFDDGTDTRYELFDGQIFAMRRLRMSMAHWSPAWSCASAPGFRRPAKR